MSSPAAPTIAATRILRRFRRNRRGSAAVEFAFIAPLFFALLFATLETGIMFFASQGLETMTQDAARLVLTGQVSNNPTVYQSAQDLINAVCSPPPPAAQSALFDCTKVSADVKSYTAFQNIVINSQIDDTDNFTTAGLTFSPGGPGSIVVVRFFYQWPLFVTGLGYNISNLAGNKRLLVATAAFQNEP